MIPSRTPSTCYEALRHTQRVAAPVAGLGRTEASELPAIDAALALGRLTGLTGKGEVS
jgi:hypothetical protein